MRDVRKHFSVQFDIFFLKHIYEFAVRNAEGSGRRVYSGIPQSSKVAFFVSPMSKSVSAGVKYSFVRLLFFVGSAKSIPLSHSKDILSGF